METVRDRETTNKFTGERHEVESENFQKVVQDFESPTSIEHFVEYTPTTNLSEFLHHLD